MTTKDNPFQKNFELWQQLNETTMQNIFTTFEKNLAQSRAFQDQMQTAVGQVVNSQFDMVQAGLKNLESQMAEVTKNINSMVQPNGK
ncbi:MAG: hypothetical protein WAM60_00445 [Candidatus Promineifilaceae bacterium]